jgi:hypothetical protein
MIRESLDAGSRHASIFLTETGNGRFESRSAANGDTASTQHSGLDTPYWLRLVRSGNSLTGSVSPDGQTWTVVSSQIVLMEADVFVGMASSSQNAALFCDAVFRNVDLDNDSDGDELQDIWELAYFDNLTTTAGGPSNQDGDVNTDLEESLLGTDPTRAVSVFRPTLSRAETGLLELSFEGVANYTYTLEVNYVPAGESWTSAGSVTPNHRSQQTLEYSGGGGPTAIFGRVVAGG